MSIRAVHRGYRDRGVDARGAAAVEMLIIFPILLVLTIGIIEFGFVFNAQISLSQAAREGVRVGAIGDDLTSGNMVARFEEAYTGLGEPTANATPCQVGDTAGDAVLEATLPFTAPISEFGPFDLSARAVMRCGG
jgi:Flp pilus assembly protein TadG